MRQAICTLVVGGVLAFGLLLSTVGCGGGSFLNTKPVPAPATTNSPTPAILISGVYPASATAGGVDFSLNVTGSGFAQGSVILWNGAPRATTVRFFTNAASLTTKITAQDIAQAGTAKIAVLNPAVGTTPSATSATTDFPISALHLASISPATATEGSGATTLVLNGAGFPPASVVKWNGYDRPTSFISSSQLSITVSPADLAAANLAEVSVSVSASEESNRVLFPIVPPSLPAVERVRRADDASVPAYRPAISADGSFVAYAQASSTSGYEVLLKRVCDGAAACADLASLVSVNFDGQQATLSYIPSVPVLSADARFVSFSPGDYGYSGIGMANVGIRDTCAGASPDCTPSTAIASGSSGPNLPQLSAIPALSADGRRVAFTSGETDGYGFNTSQVFVGDSCPGAAGSCPHPPTPLNFVGFWTSTSPQSLSADGRYLAFFGDAGDDNRGSDIGAWVYDLCVNATGACTPAATRVSIQENGSTADSGIGGVAISATGRFVALSDGNFITGVLLRDTCVGASAGCVPSSRLVSVNSDGKPLQTSANSPSISADGRKVAYVLTWFDSYTQSVKHAVALRDTCAGVANCTPRTFLLSHGAEGTPADGPSTWPMISSDGRFVVFESTATDLIPGGTSGVSDIFRAALNSGAAAASYLRTAQQH